MTKVTRRFLIVLLSMTALICLALCVACAPKDDKDGSVEINGTIVFDNDNHDEFSKDITLSFTPENGSLAGVPASVSYTDNKDRKVTAEELRQSGLTFASGETDTGVIISFNCEAENIDKSIIVPEGYKTLAINPLNWKTDGTPADKSLNKGACFYDAESGTQINEIDQLTGAYIDTERGTLKVTDIDPQEYDNTLGGFVAEGVYHFYDYQFFYRNLEENVKKRIGQFTAA